MVRGKESENFSQPPIMQLNWICMFLPNGSSSWLTDCQRGRWRARHWQWQMATRRQFAWQKLQKEAPLQRIIAMRRKATNCADWSVSTEKVSCYSSGGFPQPSVCRLFSLFGTYLPWLNFFFFFWIWKCAQKRNALVYWWHNDNAAFMATLCAVTRRGSKCICMCVWHIKIGVLGGWQEGNSEKIC